MLFMVTAASLVLAATLALFVRRRADEERYGAAGPSSPIAAEVTAGHPSRTAAAIAVAVFVVGSGAALAVVLSSSAGTARPSALPRAAGPLELVALGHEREGAALAIHGIVRNPSGGAPLSDLSAVVFLFDRTGRPTTSARAAIDNDHLAPGAESRFSIVVPAAGDVARYRVSFRTDRGIMTHVDRRGSGLEGSP